MTLIKLSTVIQAPIGVCFDLARSVDVHLDSMSQTGERVVAGRKSGLCEVGDTITWEARHFGIRQHLTVRIIRIDYPVSFDDEMITGAFQSMHHRHEFLTHEGVTTMVDYFNYKVPFGPLGFLFDVFVLKGYMTRLLSVRNSRIKALAESR